MEPRNRYLPWIALGAVYILWGSTYLAIRVAVSTIPPFLMLGTRYLIAGSLLLGIQWALARKKPAMPTRDQLVRMGITALFLLVGGNGLLCLTETRVESGTAALLVASTPIWMLLFDALRERQLPSWTSIGGLALGSAGMALLVGRAGGHGDTLYAVLIVVGAMSWAFGTIFARGNAHHPFAASQEMLLGGAGGVIVGLLAGELHQVQFAAISAQSLWGMAWLVTGGAMVGYTAYAYVVRSLPTATVATYAYVNPVVAVILGALLLGEPVTWNLFAGGAAIVGSVVLILLGNRKEAEAVDEIAAPDLKAVT